jgi:hypothetical protein
MTDLDQEQAVAVLTVVPPQGDAITRVFVEGPHQDLDPFHRAERRRDALLVEHPDATVTIGINERALDAAVAMKMHALGHPDYTTLDAEQTRQALEDEENQS